MNSEELKEKLFYKPKNAFEHVNAEELERSMAYAEAYKLFLDSSKTERDAVKYSVETARRRGYVPYDFGMKLEVGGKYYYDNRGKSLYLFRIGEENPENGIYVSASHIDSPRLDLKQNPLYEDGGMGLFKTHYYGGIKKYQWTTVPLALHGVVTLKDGKKVDVCIGEDDGDPVFFVSDLLVHLSSEQMKKSLADGVGGEDLNIVIGSRPYGDKSGDSAIKLNILNILNEKYGMTEDDFLCAELTAVPADKARDVGFDRSIIGAYGHDDKVCSYPALTALLDCKSTKKTLMVVLADKEEVGSMGNTGMKSRVFDDLLEEISDAFGCNIHTVRKNSKCLSADVTAAFDPNYPDAFERRNAAYLNGGVALSKFTGARGKSGTSDACAEFTAYVRKVLDDAGVVWQMAELGKVDRGGGGTVAQFIADKNIDTIDVGVPVLSMHAPQELISKLDLYMTYKAFSAFNA